MYDFIIVSVAACAGLYLEVTKCIESRESIYIIYKLGGANTI